MDRLRPVVMLLFLTIIVFAVLPIVNAEIYSIVDDLTNLSTCGLRPPNSLLGYGAAAYWPIVFNCNNVRDGMCPEDYQDSYDPSIFGNCSSCLDPDCVGTISGYVYDERGPPYSIYRSVVESNPVKWNLSAPSMSNSVETLPSGYFNMTVITGTYYFTASKDSYDTEVKEATVVRNKNTVIEFKLLNGTCHDDCTDSYGRCSAKCNGQTFAATNTNCSFYDARAAQVCNLRLKGTLVFYNISDSTTANFLTCCENAPEKRYYSQVNIDSSSIKDLIKIEKIGKYYDSPVRVIVAYWSPVNK